MKNKLDDIGWEIGAAYAAYIPESGLKEDRDSWWDPHVNNDGQDDLGGLAVADKLAHYSSNDPGLIETAPYEVSSSIHHIADAVIANSLDDDPGGSRPGPITTFVVG